MSKSLDGTSKVTSVWLAAEKNSKGKYKLLMFKCPKCTVPVVQYKGDIIKIVPGETPYVPKTLLKCKGNYKNENQLWEECSMLYEFLGVSDFVKNDTINYD